MIDEIDAEAMTVTMQGGTTYGQLCRFLAKRGCGLAMTASLPHVRALQRLSDTQALEQVSVAGAVATGTHGSGLQHRNLVSVIAILDQAVSPLNMIVALYASQHASTHSSLSSRPTYASAHFATLSTLAATCFDTLYTLYAADHMRACRPLK